MIQRTILRSSQQATRALTRPQSQFASIRQPSSGIWAAPSSSLRWYSEAPATPKEGDLAAKGATEQATPQDADAAKLREQLGQKDKEIIDLKDKYLRSVADFRNLQERTKREVQAAKDFALQRFARDLIDSIDNLDRALSTVPAEKLAPENNDLVTLHDGLKMTDNILLQTLKKHGLERFDPSIEKEKFNPNIHEAVFQTPQPDKEDGTVFHTQQKGFTLNGRILRAAKVGVVKNS